LHARHWSRAGARLGLACRRCFWPHVRRLRGTGSMRGLKRGWCSAITCYPLTLAHPHVCRPPEGVSASGHQASREGGGIFRVSPTRTRTRGGAGCCGKGEERVDGAGRRSRTFTSTLDRWSSRPKAYRAPMVFSGAPQDRVELSFVVSRQRKSAISCAGFLSEADPRSQRSASDHG
jgi:hypothetical protein